MYTKFSLLLVARLRYNSAYETKHILCVHRYIKRIWRVKYNTNKIQYNVAYETKHILFVHRYINRICREIYNTRNYKKNMDAGRSEFIVQSWCVYVMVIYVNCAHVQGSVALISCLKSLSAQDLSNSFSNDVKSKWDWHVLMKLFAGKFSFKNT